MAEPDKTGDVQMPPTDDNLVAKHSKTVAAAQAAGAKAEAKRRTVIDAVFAGFYDADPMSPVTAIYDACINDVKCTELDARRKLQGYLAESTSNPAVAAEGYSVPDQSIAPPRVSNHLGGMTQGSHNDEKIYAALTEAVSHKVGIKADADRNNPFIGFTFSEMARNFAKACGVAGVDQSSSADVMKAVLDRNTNIRLALGAPDIRAQHSTGDFAGVLANVIDKAIRSAYEQTAETWRSVVRVGSVNDFRQANRPAMSAFDDLLVVPEGG